MLEVWKPIPRYKNLYQISSKGKVKSLARVIARSNGRPQSIKERLLKIGSFGEYLSITLSKKGKNKSFFIHELVALAFIGPRPLGLVVRHLDSNKDNNFYKNLAYGSNEQNYKDKLKVGTQSYGENHGKSKLTFEEVGKIRRLYLKGMILKEISEITEIKLGTVWTIAKNTRWDPRKHIEYISELEKEGNFQEAARIKKELKIICPKGWLKD